MYFMRTLLCKPVFSIFEFYAGNCASVFTFEYLSNLGTMPTSLGVADVTDKHHHKACYDETKTCKVLAC